MRCCQRSTTAVFAKGLIRFVHGDFGRSICHIVVCLKPVSLLLMINKKVVVICGVYWGSTFSIAGTKYSTVGR